MRTVLLYTGVMTATTDNAATYDILESTILQACTWAVHFNAVADDAGALLHLSKAPASQMATNNVKDVLSIWAAYSNLVTSGLAQPCGAWTTPIGQSLKVGDRVAIHYTETGVVSMTAFCLLHFNK